MNNQTATAQISKRRWLVRLLTALLLCFVTWQWGQAATIHAKAVLAQHFIKTSWQQSLESKAAPAHHFKPWSWADTWPVGRLQWVASHQSDGVKEDLYILAGADGSSLAFGPGHLYGSALPGEGSSAIAGHRDTHFRFLQHLDVGDLLRVQQRNGRWIYYRAATINVVNADEHRLTMARDDRLYLITCYPFDALQANGPLRYVVEAEKLVF